MNLGEVDLYSSLMMPANNPKRKLAQVDLINISAEELQFGWTQTILHPKGEYSLTLLVSQYLSVHMNLAYMELTTKGTQ